MIIGTFVENKAKENVTKRLDQGVTHWWVSETVNVRGKDYSRASATRVKVQWTLVLRGDDSVINLMWKGIKSLM